MENEDPSTTEEKNEEKTKAGKLTRSILLYIKLYDFTFSIGLRLSKVPIVIY